MPTILEDGLELSFVDRPMLSVLTFQAQYERFEKAVLKKSGQEFNSFRQGLPSKQEGYKEWVRTRALSILGWESWKESQIGTGQILARVVRAIEIDEGTDRRNNLVAWHPRFGPKSVSHYAIKDPQQHKTKRTQLETALYDLFKTNRPHGEVFETLRELGLKRYDLLAYLFFLKDWDRFMPISTTNFDRAFQNLGLDVKTTRQCSWENYCQYNNALHQVLDTLRNIAGLDDVRLIDAHSFCWMLARLKIQAVTSDMGIPLPEGLISVQAVLWKDGGPLSIDIDEAAEKGVEDYERQAKENRRRGAFAEEYALKSERERLKAANRPDLAAKVMSVSNKPSLGYDIKSWEITEEPRYIEVKAARRSGKQYSFFLSENERNRSRNLQNYFFYLVFGVDEQQLSVQYLTAEQLTSDSLKPINYFVRFLAEESF